MHHDDDDDDYYMLKQNYALHDATLRVKDRVAMTNVAMRKKRYCIGTIFRDISEIVSYIKH